MFQYHVEYTSTKTIPRALGGLRWRDRRGVLIRVVVMRVGGVRGGLVWLRAVIVARIRSGVADRPQTGLRRHGAVARFGRGGTAIQPEDKDA